MHEINAAYSGFITSIPTQRFRRLSVKAAGCHGYLSQPVSDAEAPMLNVTVRWVMLSGHRRMCPGIVAQTFGDSKHISVRLLTLVSRRLIHPPCVTVGICGTHSTRGLLPCVLSETQRPTGPPCICVKGIIQHTHTHTPNIIDRSSCGNNELKVDKKWIWSLLFTHFISIRPRPTRKLEQWERPRRWHHHVVYLLI